MLSSKLNLLADNGVVGRTRPTVKNAVINLDKAKTTKPDLRRVEHTFQKLNRNQQEQTS